MFHPAGLTPGTTFGGDFRILRPLGQGGMGAVYLVEQLSTGRQRALKLMLPQLASNESLRARFEQEARVGSRVNSDHIVEVVAAGVDAATGAPWLAMEFLEGETMASVLVSRGRLAPDELLEVFRQLCHALGEAHRVGLVHRDIKPDNIFLARPRREGVPFTLKVLDFGIAKLTQEAGASGTLSQALGTPLWMAPEQSGASAIRPSTDVWALGLIAYRALAGINYWKAPNEKEANLTGLLAEILVEPLEPASQRAARYGLAATLPPSFDGWFQRCVAREPSQRFADASAALAALVPVLAPGAGIPAQVAAVSPAYAAQPASTAAAMPAAATVPAVPAVPAVPQAPAAPASAALPLTTGTAAAVAATAPSPRKSLSPLLLVLVLAGVLGVLLLVAVAASLVLYRSLGPGPVASSSAPAGSLAVAAASGAAAAEQDPGASAAASSDTKGGPAPARTAVDPKPPAGADAGGSPPAQQDAGSTGSKRNLDTSGFTSKVVRPCWKGNEGNAPNAPHPTVQITLGVGPGGGVRRVAVGNAAPYPGFRACVVSRGQGYRGFPPGESADVVSFAVGL